MPLSLPTDTAHLHLETRQYELFNRPLGQGVSRRKAAVASVLVAVWILLLLLVGVDPFTQYGPTVYFAPPAILAWVAVKTGDDGRMTIMSWYDAVLARLPARRRVIRNPLLPLAGAVVDPVRVTADMTELHPGRVGTPLTPLLQRRRDRS